jgi:RNA polymerase sigma factor (sigma-70 family)
VPDVSHTTEPADLELLRRHACDADGTAFARLVERHIGWIAAAARRRLRDDHLADDAVQAVCLVLADKAAQLAARPPASLDAWLFHVMHFACSRIRRSRARRERHERHAGVTRDEDCDVPDENLLALLEDSIAQLAPRDRETVVRRYYRREDFSRIGAALDLSPDAARKHLARALARLRTLMLRDRVDVIPDALLEAMNDEPRAASARGARPTTDPNQQHRVSDIAKGTIAMLEEAQDLGFAVVSAEFYVRDVEANLDFFEKLGFQRRWTETPDAMGRLPRASLRGGVGRIWLRRADDHEGTRPAPGVVLHFWIEGGADALTAHRDRIAARGVPVSPFFDDHALRHFTVTTPDGYTIAFFTQYR